MEFFGIGLFELAMVMIVALIVVGPDRLPETAREIGKMVRTLRRYAAGVQSELKEGLGELTSEVEATKGEFRDLSRELRASGRDIERGLQDTSDLAQGEFVDAEVDPKLVAGRGRRNGASRPTPRKAPRPADLSPGRSPGRKREKRTAADIEPGEE
ncbi:MAG: Sec-independent protein translocase protein TatB [Dehalococcoidia bacterium]